MYHLKSLKSSGPLQYTTLSAKFQPPIFSHILCMGSCIIAYPSYQVSWIKNLWVEILPKPLCNTIKMIYTYFVLKWHMTELSSMCLHSNLNNRQPLLRFKWPDPYCFLQN